MNWCTVVLLNVTPAAVLGCVPGVSLDQLEGWPFEARDGESDLGREDDGVADNDSDGAVPDDAEVFGEAGPEADVDADADADAVSDADAAPDADADGVDASSCLGAGDNCSCAMMVAPSGGVYTGSTTGMADDYDPTGAACHSAPAPDVIYSFTPSTGGTWYIDTIGSAFDTVLTLLSGACPGTEIVCDDDGGGGYPASRIVATLTASVTYYVVVDGYDSRASGTFSLRVSATDPCSTLGYPSCLRTVGCGWCAEGAGGCRSGLLDDPTTGSCGGSWQFVPGRWYLGAVGDNCTNTCTTHGGYSFFTERFAGSGGTDESCRIVLDALGASGDTVTATSNGDGVGCCFITGARRRELSPTTEGGSRAGWQRACACNE